MKTNRILFPVVALLFATHVSSQTLEQIARKINHPIPTSELQAIRAQLERLCTADPGADGLFFYYLAYADIELSFRVEGESLRSQYLTDAQKYLDQIVGGDESEVETLRGYWYFALMAIDPKVNGPKYASRIVGCYEKALKRNPDNPRAVLLYAVFKDNMRKSLGGKYDGLEADIVRARELFAAQDTLSVHPHWGSFTSPRPLSQPSSSLRNP
jgi:hypothetical protein